MSKEPDKIFGIDSLRIKRNMRKICSCENPQYDVDSKNRAVWCQECGAWIDSFDAIMRVAEYGESLEKQLEVLEKQIEELYEKRDQIGREILELAEKKPRLLLFRKLEKDYRGKEMLPVCPHCKEGFFFEDIVGWVNRKFYGIEPVKKGAGKRNEGYQG